MDNTVIIGFVRQCASVIWRRWTSTTTPARLEHRYSCDRRYGEASPRSITKSNGLRKICRRRLIPWYIERGLRDTQNIILCLHAAFHLTIRRRSDNEYTRVLTHVDKIWPNVSIEHDNDDQLIDGLATADKRFLHLWLRLFSPLPDKNDKHGYCSMSIVWWCI